MTRPQSLGIINLDALDAWHPLPFWSSEDAWWDEVASVLHAEGRSVANFLQVHGGAVSRPTLRSPHRRSSRAMRLPRTIHADAQQLERELLSLFDG